MDWDQQENEGGKPYQAFLEYLKVRSYEKVAQRLGKSPAYIKKIAAQWQWRARASEFDKAAVEAAQEQLKADLAQVVLTQWKNSIELQASAMKAFREKDFAKASFKSLNEIYSAASAQILKLAEQFKLFEENPAQDLTIQILPKYLRDEEEAAINQWLKEQGRPPIDFG